MSSLNKCQEVLQHTRLASSLSGRHSPNALTKVVMFFLGSGLARASIMGLWGLVKKRIICKIPSLMLAPVKQQIKQENITSGLNHIILSRTSRENHWLQSREHQRKCMRKNLNLGPDSWDWRSRMFIISFSFTIHITILWNNMMELHSRSNYLQRSKKL